ncbi:MAG: medium-chain acyl-[acyl-carrier-protein] hydrolase [Myxococcota bacterium]
MTDAVSRLPVRQTMFFGHSLGAMLGFEVARQLRARGERLPDQLVLSSRGAPHMTDPRPPIHHLSDAAFIAAMSDRYGGIPEIILREPELMALFLPALRADMTLHEQYQCRPEPALPVPIAAWCGRSDPGIPPVAMERWEAETSAAFTTRWFDGGHFYLQPSQGAVLSGLAALIR